MIKNILIFYLKYKIIIFPVVILISIFFLISIVIYPQINSFLVTQKDVDATTHKLKILNAKLLDLQSLNKDQLDSDLAKTLIFYPTDKDYPTIIGVMQSLTSSNGVDLLSLQISQTQANSNSNNYIAKAEIIGPKSNFANLLKAFDSSPRAMRTSFIDISNSRLDTVSAAITIDVYFGQAPKALGAIDQPIDKLTDSDQKILSQLSTPFSTLPNPTSSVKGKANPFQ